MIKKAQKEKINQKKSGIIKFLSIYLILMGIFFLITTLQPIRNIIGIPAKYSGSLIILPNISLNVQFGCNGLEAVMIYAVAILAYPASWKKRIIGIILGFIIIQFFNILRIVFLIYSSIHFKKLFEFMHIYVAQGIMIALSLGVFFLYLNYISNKTEIKTT